MTNFPCKNCISPKRHPGCHNTCGDYLRAKKKHDREKEERDFEKKTYEDYRYVSDDAVKKSREGRRKKPNRSGWKE